MMRVGRWCRRHKLFVATMCFVAAVVFVPMFSYFPDCYPYPYAVYKIHLSDRYRVELAEGLDSFRVHYIVLGDVVLFRFWDWLDDPHSWILNASNKAVINLVDRKRYPWLGDPPPDRIAQLAEAARDSEGFIEPTCELVRAVAIEGW
jgi:hypothetical protein